MKQVSLNPLAKHAKVKAKTEEEQLETRQLENALDKICRFGSPTSSCSYVLPATTGHQRNVGISLQPLPALLTRTPTCMCSLLAIGFGDAGAEVIANNIKSGGDIDPMVPGQKVTAIFGFCDIRQFTDTTEVLQVCDCQHAAAHGVAT